MEKYHQSTAPKNSFKLIKSSIVIYGAMMLVAFEICWWYHKNLDELFGIVEKDWYFFIRVSLVSLAFLVLSQFCLEAYFPSYIRLKIMFASIFKGVSGAQIFTLALLSSFGEEMLFRGAMQPFLGIWITSLVFALMHIDPVGRLSLWTVWAFIGGVVMGYATELSKSLWPAIFIHFGVNAISIYRLSRFSKSIEAKSLRPSIVQDPET